MAIGVPSRGGETKRDTDGRWPGLNVKRMLGRISTLKRGRSTQSRDEFGERQRLSIDLDYNVKIVKEGFADPYDLLVQDIRFPGKPARRLAAIFLHSMVNLDVVRQAVLKPLMSGSSARYASTRKTGLLKRTPRGARLARFPQGS